MMILRYSSCIVNRSPGPGNWRSRLPATSVRKISPWSAPNGVISPHLIFRILLEAAPEPFPVTYGSGNPGRNIFCSKPRAVFDGINAASVVSPDQKSSFPPPLRAGGSHPDSKKADYECIPFHQPGGGRSGLGCTGNAGIQCRSPDGHNQYGSDVNDHPSRRWRNSVSGQITRNIGLFQR